MKTIMTLTLFLMSTATSFAASTDAAQVVGDLKIDGIHFSKDGSTMYSANSLLKNKGAWSSSALYSAGDVVQAPSGSYICLIANTNTVPPNTTYWSPLGGAQGPAGPVGPAGPANKLSIGTVANGTQAAATITGTVPNQILNLTLPQGPQGIQGPACSPLGVVCGVGEVYVQALAGIRCAQIKPFPNAIATCIGSDCNLSCSQEYANCDSISSNGCEILTSNDSQNCGACGIVCQQGYVCSQSTCALPPPTVSVSAAADPAKNPLLSDLAKWSDQANRCNTATATLVNDIVNFNIVSTKLITGTASNISLQKATIIFTPGDTLTPALPAQLATTYQSLSGLTIPPNSTMSVPIEVVSHNLKLNFNPCGIAPIYTYNVQVLFDIVEDTTGRTGTLQTLMVVRMADFAD